ncbi:hypothetical protein ACGFZP_16560 [Kitasatospora sp. NPDC048239]|uniref:hypothetical protein n=1 Tax=Kitasatospora sp. NPDC048239 TaxID=3364046 RepID=UPI00371AFC8C
MRVKLRPGTHFVPTARGLHCARGERAFVLAVPPAVARLLDDRLGELTDGVDTDTLADSAGAPAAALLRRTLAALLAEDVLFDPDLAGGPVPDAHTALRHADTLAHLEQHCAQPYAAFAALRGAETAVVGAGPAARSAARSLTALGAGAVPGRPGPRTTAAVVSADDPDRLRAQAAALAPGTPWVPVLTAAGHAVVGPVLDGPAAVEPFLARACRVGAWCRVDPVGRAPALAAATLAGALAARRLLDLLGATGADPGALRIIHGRTLHTTDCPAEPPPSALRPGEPPDVTVLTEPWLGPGRWREDLALPQLPFRLAAIESLTLPGRPVLTGWGTDPQDARRDALLGLLRAQAAATAAAPTAAAPVAAAGTSEQRWLLDGLLRLLGAEAAAWSALPWPEVDGPRTRALRRALTDYHDQPVRLRRHPLPGTAWCLVEAVDPADGRRLAAQWGPNAPAAAQAALARALAVLQQGKHTATPDPAIGTRALEWAAPAELTALWAALHTPAVLRGRTPGHRRCPDDAVLGPLPLPCGPVWLTDPDPLEDA